MSHMYFLDYFTHEPLVQVLNQTDDFKIKKTLHAEMLLALVMTVVLLSSLLLFCQVLYVLVSKEQMLRQVKY